MKFEMITFEPLGDELEAINPNLSTDKCGGCKEGCGGGGLSCGDCRDSGCGGTDDD